MVGAGSGAVVSASPAASAGWLARNLGGSWTIRRRIIVATLLACGVVVGMVLWRAWTDGADIPERKAALLTALVDGAYLLAGSVIGSYVFGAVWDDKSKRGAGNAGNPGGPENG